MLVAVAAGAGSDDTTALTADLSHAFRVAAGFAAIAAVAAWLLLPRSRHSSADNSNEPLALAHARTPCA